MRSAPFLALALLLAGCTNGGDHAAHASDRWTFTERAGEDTGEAPSRIGDADGFVVDRSLSARAGMRQIGGQWHGALLEGVPFTLRFHASVDAALQFRMTTADGAAASGRCDWGQGVGEKEVALGRATMSNTTRDCEIVFTPSVTILNDEGATLRWEMRTASNATAPWNVSFFASR